MKRENGMSGNVNLLEAIEHGNRTTFEEIDKASSAINGTVGVDGTCPAHHHVVTSQRASFEAQKRQLRNQELIAKHLSNGGRGGKRFKVGPIEFNGYAVSDILAIFLSAAVVYTILYVHGCAPDITRVSLGTDAVASTNRESAP